MVFSMFRGKDANPAVVVVEPVKNIERVDKSTIALLGRSQVRMFPCLIQCLEFEVIARISRKLFANISQIARVSGKCKRLHFLYYSIRF
jgi:hypothetical protein